MSSANKTRLHSTNVSKCLGFFWKRSKKTNQNPSNQKYYCRPRINIKKTYREKSRVKQGKKPAAGKKNLVFASRFSNFRDSFNHTKTAFHDGSIKLSIFNTKLYFTWIDYKHFILVTKSFTTFITYVLWNFLKV